MFLLSILWGAFGIGPAVYGVMECLEIGQRLAPKMKRLLVATLSGLVGIGAWAAALWLGYIEAVDTMSTQYIVSTVWSYGVLSALSAFTSATLIHGYLALGERHGDGDGPVG
jgi:hypothetical protein